MKKNMEIDKDEANEEDSEDKDMEDEEDEEEEGEGPDEPEPEVEDSNQESEAETAKSNSPFKRPSDAQSVDGLSSKGGIRERHSSMNPMESDSESENSMMDRRQSATEEMSAQYAQQLAFYRKPIVGQDTVCMFCLTRCHSKNPENSRNGEKDADMPETHMCESCDEGHFA